jgi:CheY-like chemotaxis protein
MKVAGFALILLLLSATVSAAQKVEKPRPALSIAEGQQQLQNILSDMHTPGLAVANRALRRPGVDRGSWQG